MRLDRINEYVLATTVLAVGIVLAIFFGHVSGSGNSKDLWTFAAIVIYLVVCLALRSLVWVLIPMFWQVSGQLESVPGHLPFRDVVIIGVMLFFFTLKAFKIIRVRPVYTWLDALLWLVLLYVLSVFLRRPVGVAAFGSELVGGRAYYEIVFAVGAYWVLNQVVMKPGLAKIFPLLLSAVSAALAALSTITYYFPSTVPVLGKLYNGIDVESYQRELGGGDTPGDIGAERAGYLSGVGTTIVSLLTCYLSPLTLINPLYLWRFLVTVVALYFCMKSGHRITVPALAFTFILATYFRKGFAGVIILGALVLPPFFLIIAMQGRLYNLSDTAQRALCMFPGKWDPAVLAEAEGSTEWRVEMWKTVMTEDKYIHDKTFGDGFGFTKEQLDDMAHIGSQEDFMIVNDVHSGPVSAIRAIGYVGLALFLLLRLGCAIRSWTLIRATKGTPFFPFALFSGIGNIYSSFGFVFVFGDIKTDLPGTVLTVAMLNILSNGFAAYRRGIDAAAPVPAPKKPVQSPGPLPLPAPFAR